MTKNNLLKDVASHLEKEWNATKNARPFSEITTGSPTLYWWVCDKGHEWETRPVSRVKETSGCPVCANKVILEGYNDLATINPLLASEWHPTKNSKAVTEVGIGGIYVAAWLGNCGHEWEARVSARHKQGSGCPFCAGQKVLAGFNDLASNHPLLASQWHPTKNGELTADGIHQTSNKKVWWLCEKGHEWETAVGIRVRKNTKCLECSGRKKKLESVEVKEIHVPLSRARNYVFEDKSLEDLYPEIAKEWHPTKNGELTPSLVLPFSSKSVSWVCDKGHEYEMTVVHRTRGRNCPYCSGKKFKQGYNDLQTLYPKLAKEWDTANNELSASEVLAGTDIFYSWKCKDGHMWKTHILSRLNGDKCPVCVNRAIMVGVNDFPTTHPNKVSFWHPTKNGNLKPEMFVAGSGVNVWWVCDKGHDFRTSLSSFVYMDRSCNKCTQKISKQEQVIADYVTSLGFTVKQSDRTVLNGQELDIYIPEKNFAIEFNGVYWHSEAQGKGQNYHYDKWKACKDKGIHLFQVWEDDWDANPELIKTMIAHRLNVSTQGTLFARKTVFTEVTLVEARTFLSLNHLQGPRNATVYNGLRDKVTGELVAVLTATKQGDVLEVIRFASSKHVVGGFSKLLKHTLAQFPTVLSVKSYSDNNHSSGNVYEKNGFILQHSGVPNYFYIVDNKRVHRSNFTKDRFRVNPSLFWKPNCTEKQLAKLNSLVKVWDAGSSLWVLNVSS